MVQGLLLPPDRGLETPVQVAVHDCELVVRGLEVLLEPHADRVALVDLQAADLLLLDPSVPDAPVLREHSAEIEPGIVLFTWLPSDPVASWSGAPGVVGHLVKTSPAAELVPALETMAVGRGRILDGGRTTDDGLSERERQVLCFVAEGLSNQEIADRLFVTINTVKTYVRSAYRKIGVTSRSQAVSWVLIRG